MEHRKKMQIEPSMWFLEAGEAEINSYLRDMVTRVCFCSMVLPFQKNMVILSNIYATWFTLSFQRLKFKLVFKFDSSCESVYMDHV